MRAQRRKNRRERIRRMGVIDDDSAATLIRGDELQPAGDLGQTSESFRRGSYSISPTLARTP